MKITASQGALTNDYQQHYRSARQVSKVKLATSDNKAELEISTSQSQQTSIELSSIQLEQGNVDIQAIEASDELLGPSMYEHGLFIMKMLLEEMSGKKIDLIDSKQLQPVIKNPLEVTAHPGSNAPSKSGNDLMQVTTFEYESQSKRLQFSGVIERKHSVPVEFAFGVSFAQEYESVPLQVLKREQLKDPLVINFTNKPVPLSGTNFDFDIDIDKDQQTDSIAMLEAGHGFLALDRNGDHIINDGSELFGAQSGDGFDELLEFDGDQNGFIDENDSIFAKLSVRVKNEDQDEMISIEQACLAVIALDNFDSPYTQRGDDQGKPIFLQ